MNTFMKSQAPVIYQNITHFLTKKMSQFYLKFKINFKWTFQRKMKFTPMNQKGQIILEYVLLLMIGLIAAKTISNVMIKSDDNFQDMGFIRQEWVRILQVIGSDIADPK